MHLDLPPTAKSIRRSKRGGRGGYWSLHPGYSTIGLGLLGFIELCSDGSHLGFVDLQSTGNWSQRLGAVLVFSITRPVVTDPFGATIGFIGQMLIAAQTGAWVVFGLVYLFIGMAFLAGSAGILKPNIDPASKAWKRLHNPIALGIAFRLSIPTCAARILFGQLGLAATWGTVASGFVMMFLFGLAR